MIYASSLPVALVLAILLLPIAAGAQSLCSEPVAPICATAIPAEGTAATDGGVARARCLEDATTYREKLTEYRKCLEDAVTEAERQEKSVDRLLACLREGNERCVMDGG